MAHMIGEYFVVFLQTNKKKLHKAVLYQHAKGRKSKEVRQLPQYTIKLQKSFLMYIDMLGQSL